MVPFYHDKRQMESLHTFHTVWNIRFAPIATVNSVGFFGGKVPISASLCFNPPAVVQDKTAVRLRVNCFLLRVEQQKIRNPFSDHYRWCIWVASIHLRHD